MVSLTENEVVELNKICKKHRANIIRMVHNAKSGHIGGALSSTEILTVLYEKCMKNFPEWKNSPLHETRDRFVLSKGHASSLLYSVLASRGYFAEDELMTFRKIHSRLQGHPSSRLLPGVEVSTGSLGQGLAMGCGIALSLKLDKNPAHVFVLMGDGELQEGSCWEAFMDAPDKKLNNLIAIIDKNELQIDGFTKEIKSIDPLDKKLEAFNWNVLEVNGHDVSELYEAFEKAKESQVPTAIIAHTIKGKGVSFMENQCGWHGKAPSDEDLEKALAELR